MNILKWIANIKAATIAIIFGLILIAFSKMIGGSDPDPKVPLASINDPAMRAAYTQEYTQELFNMAKQGQMDWRAAQKLVESGVDINTQDELGRTPLFYAALSQNIDMTNYLLSKGADTSIRDHKDMRAIDYLDKHKDMHLYGVIFTHDLRVNAEKEGYKNVTISYSTDANGEVSALQIDGQLEQTWTPLMKAIKAADNTLAAQLIQSGAYRDDQTNNGSTAIFFAIEAKNDTALDLLLQSGVPLNFCNRLKVNPLRFAVIHNNEYGVKQLVKHGADMYEKCGNLRTPRELAEERAQGKIVKQNGKYTHLQSNQAKVYETQAKIARYLRSQEG